MIEVIKAFSRLTCNFVLANSFVETEDSSARRFSRDVVVVDDAQVAVDEGHGHVGPDHLRLALRLGHAEGHVLVLVDQAGQLDRD